MGIVTGSSSSRQPLAPPFLGPLRAAHFARQIEPLCYRTSKYRRGRSLLALCIALNTKKSTRHITSIATSDILVVVIVVTGLKRVPDKDWSFRQKREPRPSTSEPSILVVVTGKFPAQASRSCAAGRHYQFV